ncbi:MAG: hypothetical protein U0903_15160 [Planctomycetales bacterium]
MLEGISNSPILAANVLGDIIFLIVIAFTVISWISQLISGGKPKKGEANRRKGEPVRPGGNTLQNEIERFKQLVEQARAGQNPNVPPSAPSQNQPRPQISPRLQQDEAARRSSPGRINPSRAAAPPPVSKSEAKRQKKNADRKRLGDAVAERHINTTQDLNTQVNKHVQQHLNTQTLTETVQRDLSDKVSESVREHLGDSRRSQEPEKKAPVSQAKILRKLLGSRQGVQQAIIINEILQPPLARRATRQNTSRLEG